MSHDKFCPFDNDATECPVCGAITMARGEEKSIATATWKRNLPLLERRNYAEGYHDATEHKPPREPLDTQRLR